MNKNVRILFVLLILLNIYFDSIFQLHFDEAYYWVWSQNLSLSYYDHPPMIAYMMYLSNLLGAHSEFLVRLPTLIATTITILTLYYLAKKMFDQKVADITVLLALATPLFQGNFFVATIDSPLLMFWSLTLYAFYCGVFENKTKWLYLTGIFAGCALLSKYTAILILPSLLLFLITSTKYRRVLYKKDIYIAFLLAIGIFSPVIIWNYQHHWISFIYQFEHGNSHSQGLSVASIGDYILNSALLVSPLIFISWWYYTLTYARNNIVNSKLALLFWMSMTEFVFFAYFSCFKYIEGNWNSTIYLTVLIYIAYYLALMNNTWVYRISLFLIFIILLVTKLPLVIIPHTYYDKVPPAKYFYGNKELIQEVKSYLTPNTALLACDYANASSARFYLNGQNVYVLAKFPFANEYRYLPQYTPSPAMTTPIIYTCDHIDMKLNGVLRQYFHNIKLLKQANFHNALMHKTEYIYQVSN